MKIAILMYGQLRWHDFANQTFLKNFKPALNGHEIQYFAHFWDSSPDLEYSKSVDNPNRLTDFKAIYYPQIITSCKPIPVPEIKNYFNNKINKISDNLPNQIYSLNQSFDCMEKYMQDNNVKYDLYIKMRTDLAYMSPINIDNFDNDSVYLCATDRPLNEYATDLLLFTKNYNNIKTVCKMGFEFDNILQRLEMKENRALFYHEEILANYLVNKNISIKGHNFIIDLARKYA